MPWEAVRDQLAVDRSPAVLEAYQYVFDSPHVPTSSDLAAFAAISFTPGRPWLEALLDLTRRIYTEFKYDKTATNIRTPPGEVLRLRRGVCQDFAHLQIGCLRSLGLAARYVSGYLVTSPPPGQPRLVGADASHAWLSAYSPEQGWVDVDPTNDLIPSLKHVSLAWGRDYSDVSPIKGVYIGGGHNGMTVAVDVMPLAPEGDG
jgi:transglutaminase-like putative cysteine protease